MCVCTQGLAPRVSERLSHFNFTAYKLRLDCSSSLASASQGMALRRAMEQLQEFKAPTHKAERWIGNGWKDAANLAEVSMKSLALITL